MKTKHVQKIKDFVSFLKLKSPIEMTVKDITIEFFNNNNDLRSRSIKVLKERGVITTNRSWKKGKAQVWYYLDNEVDLDSLFKVAVNEVAVTKVPVKFNYKGIKEVEEVIDIKDKELAKNTYQMLEGVFTEERFILSLRASGMSKEKAWFLYTKIVEKVGFYTKQIEE